MWLYTKTKFPCNSASGVNKKQFLPIKTSLFVSKWIEKKLDSAPAVERN